MNAPLPEYSIVVPVYNSSSTLRELYDRIAAIFQAKGASFELILVNDGSDDNSGKVAADLAQDHSNVVFVDLLKNFGQQNAVLCGLSIASGRRIITMDDDLQNPPEQIPVLVDAMDQGDFEVVFGMPEHKQHQAHRNLGSDMVHFVIRKLFGEKARGASSFRIMTSTIRDCLLRYDAGFAFIDGLIFQHTRYVGYVTVEHHTRKHGASNYDLKKLALLSTNLFFNFSIAPLRFVFFAGLALSVFAGLFALYILYGKLSGTITFPGYASIMVYFSILFGALFMFLGLIGEYVGRIAQGINKAPQYSIRKIVR